MQNVFAKCPIKKVIPIPVPINGKTLIVLVLLLTRFSQACDSTDALNDHTVQVGMLDKGFGQSFLNPLHNQLELIGITGKKQVSGDPTAASRRYRPHILLVYMTEQKNHAYSVFKNPVLP